jgi:hypothetical protein
MTTNDLPTETPTVKPGRSKEEMRVFDRTYRAACRTVDKLAARCPTVRRYGQGKGRAPVLEYFDPAKVVVPELAEASPADRANHGVELALQTLAILAPEAVKQQQSDRPCPEGDADGGEWLWWTLIIRPGSESILQQIIADAMDAPKELHDYARGFLTEVMGCALVGYLAAHTPPPPGRRKRPPHLRLADAA